MKYEQLARLDIASTEWVKVKPQSPFYLFTPQDIDLLGEYNKGWQVTHIFPANVLGFQTHRDGFAIDFDYGAIYQRIKEMRENRLTDKEFIARYNLKESAGWQVSKVRRQLREIVNWEKDLMDCLYRPFDKRPCYFSKIAMDRPRPDIQNHVAERDNFSMLLIRQMQDQIPYTHILVATEPAIDRVFACSRGAATVFPLYIYPREKIL